MARSKRPRRARRRRARRRERAARRPPRRTGAAALRPAQRPGGLAGGHRDRRARVARRAAVLGRRRRRGQQKSPTSARRGRHRPTAAELARRRRRRARRRPSPSGRRRRGRDRPGRRHHAARPTRATGKRVVFSQSRQRVWLVGDDEKVQRTYLVSGSVSTTSTPAATRSTRAPSRPWGIDDSGTMKYFVRFTQGDRRRDRLPRHPDRRRQAGADHGPARHAAVARLHPAEGGRRDRPLGVRADRHGRGRHRLTATRQVRPHTCRQLQCPRSSGIPGRPGIPGRHDHSAAGAFSPTTGATGTAATVAVAVAAGTGLAVAGRSAPSAAAAAAGVAGGGLAAAGAGAAAVAGCGPDGRRSARHRSGHRGRPGPRAACAPPARRRRSGPWCPAGCPGRGRGARRSSRSPAARRTAGRASC